MNKTQDDKINLHANHRQRMRDKFLNANSFENFENHELLEMLLFYAIPQADTNGTAHRLLANFNNRLCSVFDANVNNLTSVKGVGENSAILIKLIPAIMKRVEAERQTKFVKIPNRSEAERYLKNVFNNVTNEQLYILCLGPDGSLLNYKCITGGGYSKVEVQIRTITDFVLRNDCDRIIISHNHPYSDEQPSDEDLVMTHKLCNSCILNDIDILDHIIVSPKGCYSFAGNGVMQPMKEDVCKALHFSEDSIKYNRFCTSVTPYNV